MRQQRMPACPGGFGQRTIEAGTSSARHCSASTSLKNSSAQAGAVDHLPLRRPVRVVGRQHVVVESEHVDPFLVEPARASGFRIEIERLIAQVKARIGGKLRPETSIASSRPRALSVRANRAPTTR